MIYLISDTHFCHDRAFIYQPRGFSNINEMNETIVKNWNNTVTNDDEVYVLGDFFLGQDYNAIGEILNSLKGHIHLVVGNHDTPNKITEYTCWDNIVEMTDALRITYKKRQFFLCHYPTMTASLEVNPKYAIFNLFGHTHSKKKFYNDNPFMYNVACDAHNCTPISIEEIYNDIINEIKVCKSFLL